MVRSKSNKKRCKECRCKPCKCAEEIHCYQITCGPKKNTKTKKKLKNKPKTKAKRKLRPPKGMSRVQYQRLQKSKPKNKSMKVWIREKQRKIKHNRKTTRTTSRL